MLRYTVVLLTNPEDHVLTLLVPELPGCVTQGRTIEEALVNAKEAIESYLIAEVAEGEEIPQETVPVIVATVEVSAPAVTVKP